MAEKKVKVICFKLINGDDIMGQIEESVLTSTKPSGSITLSHVIIIKSSNEINRFLPLNDITSTVDIFKTNIVGTYKPDERFIEIYDAALEQFYIQDKDERFSVKIQNEEINRLSENEIVSEHLVDVDEDFDLENYNFNEDFDKIH